MGERWCRFGAILPARVNGFSWLLLLVSFAVGAIASVSGFGIGSFLTPLLATQLGIKLAVAAVTIPHMFGTAMRFWTLRRRIDRQVLFTFGLTSAAGGLVGAMLHGYATNSSLRIVFAAILIFVGFLGVTGLSARLRFGRRVAWVAGALSGFLGGLIGNQGGIRAAAMLGFDVPKEAFVATATAIALIVDAARMPVYLATEAQALLQIWPLIALATAGVLAGTLLGRPLLDRIPERDFKRIVAGMILALGALMLFSKG